MKKPPKANGLFPACLKFDLKMKLSLLFFVTVSFVMQANESYSQKTKISLNRENTTVKEIIDEIETTTEFKFIFNTKAVNLNRRVSIKVEKVSVNVILDILFRGSDTSYEIDDRKILLTKNKPTKVEIGSLPNLIDLPPVVVKGIILDSKGLPLPGANVAEKDSKNGITTDLDGKFSITVQNGNAVLVVSFIGFETQEISLKGQTTIKVILKESAAGLNEIVVVGYGTKKKVNLTGSVSTVSGTTLTKRPVTNAATMLQGLLPGVSVMQTNGIPGQGNVKIQVRGLGTFSGAGANPLVLVDGVEGNMEDLNPNTIESISVLKDAASASIYGSRAANGVILITTKNGANSNGQTKISYDFSYSSKTPTKLLDLVTYSPDYMRAFNTNVTNSNYGVPLPNQMYTDQDIASYTNPSDPIKYPSFDWQKTMIHAAPTLTHNLNISGGDKTHYNLSFGYVDDKGTMDVYSYKRLNAQLNLVSNVSNSLKLGASVILKNGISTGYSYGGGQDFDQTNYYITIISQPTTIMPTLPGHPELYSWRAFPFESNNWNSLLLRDMDKYTSKDYTLLSQAWADIALMKDLHWYTKVAANYQNVTFSQFSGKPVDERLYHDASVIGYGRSQTSLTKRDNLDIYTNLYSYLTYDKQFGSHKFNLMVGYNTEESNGNILGAGRVNFPSPTTSDLNAGSANGQTNNGSSSSWAIESIFSRLSYDFDGKYLFEANVRRDATSRLSSDVRSGVFPSVSAGWKFSKESFMDSSKSWLSNGKLRASWGQLGNQNIGNYPYQALLSLTGAYPFNNSSLSPGVAQTALNNPNITWETTTSSDIGIDLTFFNKLSVSFDYFKKMTTDILRPAQVTSVLGLTAPTINGGEMENKGFDLDMSYNDQVKSGTFSGLHFGAALVVSSVKNKLVKFGVPQDNGYTIYEEGKPWESFYLLDAIGIFQSTAEIANSPKQFGENTQPGTLKYRDVNGDGVIDNSDRVVMPKGIFPDFTYGFRLSADWKGFDLYAFFQGVAGSKTWVNGWGVQPFIQGTPPTKQQLADAWTPQNHSTTTVAIGDPISFNHPSTYTYYDNSYFRLKTIQIGYTLPEEVSMRIKASKIRFYLAGDNLFTVTNYPGLDPEGAGYVKQFYGFSPAISYPQNKVITFGGNFTF